MNLPSYQTPSKTVRVTTLSSGETEPENHQRVWVILHNPGKVPVAVVLGIIDQNPPSFQLKAGENKTLPMPVYYGPISVDGKGDLTVTQLLLFNV